jgi:hypothetical protein
VGSFRGFGGSIQKEVKGSIVLGVNIIAIFATAWLIINFAFAPWSWNPIEDLLYVRSDGFILPANHISSAVAVAGTAMVFMLRDTSKAAKMMFVIFSTASIHEFILDGLNVLSNSVSLGTLSYVLNFRWFFWLSFFLIPALVVADGAQRKTMLRIAVFCFAYMFGWYLVALYFHINTYTILGYAPGPAYHDFLPNFFEVSAWVIPASFWWWMK